jgi:glycosyltransferase involved in cell wall biosynthesis
MLIPAFNAASHLPRLLESAARQTEPFDEIWVYDDCSTDNTAEIAEQFGARVVRGDVNRGCSHGKNVLAAQTEAKWIHFHDADDELKPNFVALARRWAMEFRFDVVLFAFEVCDGATGAHLSDQVFDHSELGRDPRSYAIRQQINAICGLYRRDRFLFAGGYEGDPEVLYNEDVAMHIRLAFAGLSFAAESEVSIINHRWHDSMSSANRLRCFEAQYHVMRRTAMRDSGNRYAAEISRRLWQIAECLAAELDWQTADKAVLLATELSGLDALPEGSVFKLLNLVSPRVAIRVREWIIRAAKPQLRVGYRGWRLGGV